ncbi:uncharacterized protein DS421_18g615780 [Arachis hypogaea]|nr:uncharacterized protein DS421_18g615780 [Arachis hypogaea]
MEDHNVVLPPPPPHHGETPPEKPHPKNSHSDARHPGGEHTPSGRDTKHGPRTAISLKAARMRSRATTRG